MSVLLSVVKISSVVIAECHCAESLYGAVMLSFIIAGCCYAENRNAECRNTGCRYAEFNYAECHDVDVSMLSVIMLSDIIVECY